MLIEQALMTYLKAQTGVTGYVARRIYFVKAPQKTAAPYIVISKVDAPRGHVYSGAAGTAHPRFQLTVFAEKYSECKDIAAAVQTALQGYSGTMGGASGVAVGGVFYDNETDLDPGDGKGLFGVACDYIISHSE